jgi:hypothetical protein
MRNPRVPIGSFGTTGWTFLVELLHECFDYDPETGGPTWRERPRERRANWREIASHWRAKADERTRATIKARSHEFLEPKQATIYARGKAMYLGTAFIIVFAFIAAFSLMMAPGKLLARLFGRLAVVVTVLAAIWFLYVQPQKVAENLAYHKRNVAQAVAECRGDTNATGWRAASIALDGRQDRACNELPVIVTKEDGGDAYSACIRGDPLTKGDDKLLGEYHCLNRIKDYSQK